MIDGITPVAICFIISSRTRIKSFKFRLSTFAVRCSIVLVDDPGICLCRFGLVGDVPDPSQMRSSKIRDDT